MGALIKPLIYNARGEVIWAVWEADDDGYRRTRVGFTREKSDDDSVVRTVALSEGQEDSCHHHVHDEEAEGIWLESEAEEEAEG